MSSLSPESVSPEDGKRIASCNAALIRALEDNGFGGKKGLWVTAFDDGVISDDEKKKAEDLLTSARGKVQETACQNIKIGFSWDLDRPASLSATLDVKKKAR